MFDWLFTKSDSGVQLLLGSVGWDDADDCTFLGEDENDGYTLVRVQLFEGRDITKPINPKRAQGHKIICHISSLNGLRIPPKDTRVYVACPKGMENVPGGGVIIAAVEKLPRGAGNVKQDETVIFGRDGSQGRVVVKDDGTVALMTTAANAQGGQAIVLSVGPNGLRYTSPWGTMRFDASGYHVRTKAGPAFRMGGIKVAGLPDEIAGAITGYCTIECPVFTAKSEIVNLGPGPLYLYAAGATGAQYAANTSFAGMTPAANASSCVRVSFVSP